MFIFTSEIPVASLNFEINPRTNAKEVFSSMEKNEYFIQFL